MKTKKFTNSFAIILFGCIAVSLASWGLGVFVSPIIPIVITAISIIITIVIPITPYKEGANVGVSYIHMSASIFLSSLIVTLQFHSYATKFSTDLVSLFLMLAVLMFALIGASSRIIKPSSI